MSAEVQILLWSAGVLIAAGGTVGTVVIKLVTGRLNRVDKRVTELDQDKLDKAVFLEYKEANATLHEISHERLAEISSKLD